MLSGFSLHSLEDRHLKVPVHWMQRNEDFISESEVGIWLASNASSACLGPAQIQYTCKLPLYTGRKTTKEQKAPVCWTVGSHWGIKMFLSFSASCTTLKYLLATPWDDVVSCCETKLRATRILLSGRTNRWVASAFTLFLFCTQGPTLMCQNRATHLQLAQTTMGTSLWWREMKTSLAVDEFLSPAREKGYCSPGAGNLFRRCPLQLICSKALSYCFIPRIERCIYTQMNSSWQW